MSLFTLITYCVLGLLSFVILFLIRNKYKITRLYNTIFSLLLMVVYASIFSYFGMKNINTNIFIVIIFQFIFDFIYTTYIHEEDFFNKTDANTTYYFILILISLLLNNLYINNVSSVFLTGEDIRLLFWGLIIIFLYKFISDNNIFERNYNKSKMLDEGSILTMFTKLRRKYLNDIRITDIRLELAIYSIMIYYNNKRSSFFRKIDNFKFKINGNKRKLGIMQIESAVFISDLQSIDMVTKDLKKILGKRIVLEVWNLY